MKLGTVLALTALCAVGVSLAGVLPLNPDVAWYVQATRQWAAGQQLYVEIGDINLPSVYLLHRLAYEIAALGGRLQGGQGDYHALLGLFGLLLLAATLLARHILHPVQSLPAAARATLVFAFPVVAVLAALGNFLQREHWILVALLPHALCLYRLQQGAPPSRGLAMTAAVLAAAIALLKPHFLLPYLLLEAYVALRRRSPRLPFRTENLIAAAIYLAGAGGMALFYPSYFAEILPRAQDAYPAYSHGWFVILARSDVYIPCGLALLLLALAGRLTSRPTAELARLLLILALAFAASYLVQQKGWYYQFVPALAYSVLGSAVLLAAVLSEQLLPRLRRGLAAPFTKSGLAFGFAAGLAALLPLHLAYLTQLELRGGWTYGEDVRALVGLLEEDPDGGYLNLSPAIHPAFPAATLAHARWVYDQPSLWELPRHYRPRFNDGKIVPPRPPAKQSAKEHAFFRGVVEAFVTQRPLVVSIVDPEAPPQLWERDFDFLAYFLQDPGFAAAWEDYEPWGRIPNHRVYLRKGGDG